MRHHHHNSSPALVAALICLATFLYGPAAARPSGEAIDSENVRELSLDRYLDYRADDLQTFLKAKGESKVGVVFTGPPTFQSSGGAYFTQLLSEKLAKRGIRVAANANYAFRGEFSADTVDEVKRKKLVVRVTGTVVDKFNKPVPDWTSDRSSSTISNQDEIVRALGLTGDFQNLSDSQSQDGLLLAYTNPNIVVRQNGARSHEKSPFAVELLIGARPLPLERKDGFAYASLKLGDEYQVRLANDSDQESAALVAVDGLNIFHFSELRDHEKVDNSPRYTRYIVPAKGQVVVPGWFKSMERSEGFRIVPLQESAAARLGMSAQIGMVTVTFQSCWEKSGRPPADEPNYFSQTDPFDGFRRTLTRTPEGMKWKYEYYQPRLNTDQFVTGYVDIKLGTGFGEEKKTELKAHGREFGQPRATVTIRYQNASPQE